MAQRTVIVTTDDISGEEVSEENAATIEFEYDGLRYVIDLGPDNAQAFHDAMTPWIEHATRVTRRNSNVTSIRSKPRSKRIDADNSTVRAWAEANGVEVSKRGRISEKVRQQFAESQGESRSQAAAV